MKYLGIFESCILPKGDWQHIFKGKLHIMYMLPNRVALRIIFNAITEEFAVFEMDDAFVMDPKHIEAFCFAIADFKENIKTIISAKMSFPMEPPLTSR